jgi:hypothetical protein
VARICGAWAKAGEANTRANRNRSFFMIAS